MARFTLSSATVLHRPIYASADSTTRIISRLFESIAACLKYDAEK
jgi:hypothetical protein